MYGRPAKNMLTSYTEGLKDWEKRTNTVVHPRYGDVAYEGLALLAEVL